MARTASLMMLGRRTQESSERTVVAFATVELFTVIFFQRIALTPNFSVPLLAMLGGIGLGYVFRWFAFGDPYRVAAYMFFLTACLISESFAHGHIMSLLQLLAIYSCWTINTTVSDAAYRRILKNFNWMMIGPAIIIVVQFSYQKLTGLPNPITMTGFVPDSLVVQGYSYDLHYPWNSVFTRPTGFVFLEASFSSMFAATAAIIEIMYFRRWYIVSLMIIATFMSMGATGISMLFIAGPFLLMREKSSVVMATMAGVFAALALAIALDLPLPVISRAGELDTRRSSGGERVLLPLEKFTDLVVDPTFTVSGEGAGADLRSAFTFEKKKQTDPTKTSEAVASLWPMVKVLKEYGLLAMLAYVVLFATAMRGRFNVPLKIALSAEFLFTGGYLVNPAFLGLLMPLFLVVTPESAQRQRRP